MKRITLAATAAGTSLLAAACGSAPTAAHTVAAVATPPGAVADCLTLPVKCFTPQELRVAYGIRPLLAHGVDGRGETVTVLDLAADPTAPAPANTDLRQDLRRFDGLFHLPAAHVGVVTTLAGASAPWAANIEEVEDTEMVHAVAPDAGIRVVLIPLSTLNSAADAVASLTAGLRLATARTDVLSISASLGEHFFTRAQATRVDAILRRAAARHVTVVASAGDQGAVSDSHFNAAPVKEVSLPASDPLVLATGGTRLDAKRSGAYVSETAWNDPPTVQGQDSVASAGGFSHLFPRPAYQVGVPGTEAMRGVPDVAGDAEEQTGMTVTVEEGGGKFIIGSTSGTSASAPLWAGLVALADQEAHHDLGPVNAAIYRVARGPRYHAAFHDVTTGDNTVVAGSGTVAGYPAAPGWDPVTGWGTPDAAVLVPLLASR